MAYLIHEYIGRIDPELKEVEDLRKLLSSLTLETIKNVAELRRNQRNGLQLLIKGPPMSVQSPTVYYEHPDLDQGQEVAAWLSTTNYLYKAELFTQIVADQQTTLVSEAGLQLSVDKADGVSFAIIEDRTWVAGDQLELVTSSIDTVELIRLETQALL
jgi:hypothetical protein